MELETTNAQKLLVGKVLVGEVLGATQGHVQRDRRGRDVSIFSLLC